MSKKNNRNIKARQHAFDIEREKKAAEEAKQRAQKRAAKENKLLKVKKKPIKLRKNMRIRGIKIKDSDSKKKVMKILRRERAEKVMDVDKPKVLKKKLKVKKKVGVSGRAPPAAAAPSSDAMEI